MNLCIQDPSYKDSMYLHESLLTACDKSVSGGGAYAFATKDGVELLLEDESFRKMINKGSFFLIVGMDDITNFRALQALKSLQEKYNGHLIVKVYVHNSKGSTFHPKFSWFKTDDGGILVIGSGNLTQQGLRHNREAFSVIECDNIDFQSVLSDWEAWINHSQPFLFDVDDDVVLTLAEKNSKKTKAIYKAKSEVEEDPSATDSSVLGELFKKQPPNKYKTHKKTTSKQSKKKESDSGEEKHVVFSDDEVGVDELYWVIDADCDILVAEIPRSGNRWKQVNFDKETFENYFGATCGENGEYRILLRNVGESGELGETEVRPSVSVSSHNYRFELEAAAGIEYPSDGRRPLSIFAKVSPRDFIYEVVMPDGTGYSSLLSALDSKAEASSRMRRLTYYCNEIQKMAPELAIWKRVRK